MKRITTRGVITLLSALLICSSATQAQTITTFAGDGTAGFAGDGGQAIAAQMNGPKKIVFDAAGNLYIADAGNHRIRKIDVAGIITTVAGTGVAGSNGDGGLATAADINTPYAIAFDHSGNMYIAEYGGARIRKVNTSGIISTVAGTGVIGNTGDGGPATAARLGDPTDVTLDAADNIFITDPGNNTVRMIDNAGIITTVAGTGIYAFTGDGGPATAATLNTPHSVTFDNLGNMYISDQYNVCIRMVNTSGIISTVAGIGGAGGYAGDGGPATAANLFNPTSTVFDANGNMYLTNYNAYTVRVVNNAGIISTFAGSIYSGGYSGDGGAATSAKMREPYCVAVDQDGNVYISENNSVIRKVTIPPCTSVDAGTISSSHGPVFCGNDSTILTLNGANAGSGITYQWQASGDNITWHNIGSNVSHYATGMLDTQTYFRVIVTCVPAGISDTASYGITPQPIVTPTVFVSANPGTTVVAGVSVTFSTTISGGGSNPIYQWQKNGVDIPGATNSTYTSNTLADNDSITCILKSDAACRTIDSASSDTLVMHILSGVASVKSSGKFMIYPNPNGGVFHISGQTAGSKNATLQVLNVIGQVVYNKELLMQQDILDVSIELPKDISNGLYMLRISAGAETYVQHFSLYR